MYILKELERRYLNITNEKYEKPIRMDKLNLSEKDFVFIYDYIMNNKDKYFWKINFQTQPCWAGDFKQYKIHGMMFSHIQINIKLEE